MIDGIHFDVTSAEMRSHLTARVTYHRERATFYKGQEKAYADAPASGMSADPVKGLQEAGKRHGAKAEVFGFMVEHVPPNEVYRLSGSDLEQLEFVSQRIGY